MLYGEIMAVCSEIHTKHINTVCGQNVQFWNAKPQSRRPGKRGTLTVEDHDIEVVTRFKYLGMVLNDTMKKRKKLS